MAILLEKDAASLLSKAGEKNPSETTCRGIVSFSPLQRREGRPGPWSTATRAGGFAAESLDLDFLISRLNPEEGGETFATSSSARGQGLQEPLRL